MSHLKFTIMRPSASLKILWVKQAAQFYHIESYLLSATRIYILGNMPYIDNLEKMPAPPSTPGN
jgi:hypothetical protein